MYNYIVFLFYNLHLISFYVQIRKIWWALDINCTLTIVLLFDRMIRLHNWFNKTLIVSTSSQSVQLFNDVQMSKWWLLQANDGEMLVNDGEVLVNDSEIINEDFTIICSFDHHWEAAPTASGGKLRDWASEGKGSNLEKGKVRGRRRGLEGKHKKKKKKKKFFLFFFSTTAF